MIAQAAETARARIAAGGLPITQLTHHAAEDDSTRITGHIRSVGLTPDGSLTYEADVLDNEAGRAVFTAAEAGSLASVSIRGMFTGPVRTVTHEGQQVVTAEGLELDGIDWTRQPGVEGARVSTVTRLARESGAAAERVLTESAPVATVERITEDVTPDPLAAVAEAVAAAEAYLSVSGHQGRASVSVSSPAGNDDVPGTAASVAAAFTAAMAALPSDTDDGDMWAFDSHAADTTREESPMPEDESGTTTEQDGTTTPAGTTESREGDAGTTESGTAGTAGNPQVTGLSEADMAKLADLVAERMSRGNDTGNAPVEEGESRELQPGTVTEAALQTTVAEAVVALAEKLEEKVTAAVTAAEDRIRKGVVEAYGTPARTGLRDLAEAQPEKPLHEMSDEERRLFVNERLDAVFGQKHSAPALAGLR